MSETLEKQFIVSRANKRYAGSQYIPMFVFDSRVDARTYAARLNKVAKRYHYRVFPVTRGPRG